MYRCIKQESNTNWLLRITVVMVTDTFDDKTNQGKYDFYPLINY